MPEATSLEHSFHKHPDPVQSSVPVPADKGCRDVCRQPTTGSRAGTGLSARAIDKIAPSPLVKSD